MIATPRPFLGHLSPLEGSMDGYDLYFSSGGYERRYPAPNHATLDLVEGLIAGEPRRVLDFGCGSGRYAIPLAVQTPASLVAYDPCTTALSLLRQRAERAGAAARIQTMSGSLEELRRESMPAGPFDLALILFGVLGHIRHRSERLRHLAPYATSSRWMGGWSSASRTRSAASGASRKQLGPAKGSGSEATSCTSADSTNTACTSSTISTSRVSSRAN